MTDNLIRFTRGVPANESFSVELLSSFASEAIKKYSPSVLQYADARGFPPLRELLAKENRVTHERIILGQGSLHLLDIITQIVTKPGDLIFTENPSYDRALTIMKRRGCRLTGIPLEADGLGVNKVEERLKLGDRPKFFYIIPDFQNPSGSVLSMEKRKTVLKLAAKYAFLIIEDSPYYRLRYRGESIPSLFDLAPDRVLHMSSYSKLISPGLRVGYVIAPATMADPIAKWAEDTYINNSYINHAIAFEFQISGSLEKQICFLKELYLPRLDAMLNALDRSLKTCSTWTAPDGGFFIGVTLSRNIKADDLLTQAQKAGLQLTDGRNFFTDGSGDRFVRLPFCALTSAEITEGILRLSKVINQIC
jgi:2-aminoadipate transaminase